jgi:hypothetical protein
MIFPFLTRVPDLILTHDIPVEKKKLLKDIAVLQTFPASYPAALHLMLCVPDKGSDPGITQP